MIEVLPRFIPRFLSGVMLNFEIAAAALVAGLLLGLPLALLLSRGRPIRWLASVLVGTMRAAPTFVVMFFLLYAIPREFVIFDTRISLSPLLIVVLSLTVYSASYVADNAFEALQHWRAGARTAALLFLPNMARAFFVLVMASSTGAAIGVSEAIGVTLRQADSLPRVADRLGLFLLVMLFFVITLQTAFAGLTRLRHVLARRAVQSGELAAKESAETG